MDFLKFHSKRKVELEIPVMQKYLVLSMRFGTNFSVLRILSSSRRFAWYPDNHSFLLLIAPERMDSHKPFSILV